MKKKAVLVLLVSTMLVFTACTSKETDNQIEISEARESAEIKVAETEEKGKPEEMESMEENFVETVVEIVTEEAEEDIVYAGIDMESTLSAGEWVATFLDVIDEPKFVITNEETNKKVIIEDGREAVLGNGDVLGLYSPGGILGGYSGVEVTNTTSHGNYYTGFELGWYSPNSSFEVKVATDEGLQTISCILKRAE